MMKQNKKGFVDPVKQVRTTVDQQSQKLVPQCKASPLILFASRKLLTLFIFYRETQNLQIFKC